MPQKTTSGCFTDIQIKPHRATTFELMSNQELMQLLLYNRYCLTWYHMNSAQKYNMMGLGYKKFEQKLLLDQTLQDWAVWELWQEYQNKRLWNVGDKKRMHEESIRVALESRNKHRQQETEALFLKIIEAEKVKAEQDLLQKHKAQRLRQGEIVQASFQNLKDFGKQHDIVCDEFLQICEDKLLTSQLQCYQQYEMNYELDDQTRGYLLYKNIDYKEFETFVGTDLQQEFHLQACNVLKDAAFLQSKLFHESQLLTGACHFGIAAHEANKHEWTDVTGALCVIGSKLIRHVATTIDLAQPYALAVGQGIFESGYEFVHMVAHPKQTLYGIGKLIYFVLETVAIGEAFADAPHDVQVSALAEQRLTEISTGLTMLIEHCKEMDGPARVKAVTKFGADFVVPGKITGACAHLLGGICSRAKGLRNIEDAIGMLTKDFGVEQVLEYAAEGAGKIACEESVASEILTEFLETENYLSKANRAVRSLELIIDEIRNVHKGVIPFDRLDLYEEVTIRLKEIQQEMKVLLSEQFLKNNRRKVVYKNGKKYDINLSVDHILNFEFEFLKKKNLGGYKLKLSGGHISGNCRYLEEAGLVNIVNKQVLGGGHVMYTLENKITGEVFFKTEFSNKFNAETIIQKAWHIFENGLEVPAKDGKFVKKAIVEGVEMSIVLKYPGQEACNIITMLPYVEDIAVWSKS